MKLLWPLVSAAYIASCLFYLHYFVTRKNGPERVGLGILWAGFIAHTVILLFGYINLKRFPVIDLKESLCFFSWSMAGMYLAVRSRRTAGPLGTFVLPFITGFFIASALIDKVPFQPDDRFATVLFPLHILLTFSAYAAFTLAFGAGLMYIMQERGLKSRRPGALLERLPSISELDMMIYHSLAMGFVLITLGIIIGAVWLHTTDGLFFKWDPKIIFSALTWMLYAGILHARLLVGWRGRRMAAASVIGFVLVLFTFLGSGLLSKGFHGFFKFP